MSPKLCSVGRNQSLSDRDHFLHELFRPLSKCEFNSLLSAEKIGDHGEVASLHSLEQKRRPAAFDHATVNFSEFQVRIDFRFDSKKIVFTTEQIEERTKVAVHLGRGSSIQIERIPVNLVFVFVSALHRLAEFLFQQTFAIFH